MGIFFDWQKNKSKYVFEFSILYTYMIYKFCSFIFIFFDLKNIKREINNFVGLKKEGLTFKFF